MQKLEKRERGSVNTVHGVSRFGRLSHPGDYTKYMTRLKSGRGSEASMLANSFSEGLGSYAGRTAVEVGRKLK